MRLICPNCGAQYEVADNVIPEAGRDVQCSNCGHTWFEKPGASVFEEEGTEPVATVTPPAETEPEPKPEPEPEPDPEHEPEIEAESDQDADMAFEPEPAFDELPAAATAVSAGAARATSGLDPQVEAILREEAEHERAQRRAETPDPLESQPELAMDPPANVEERIARMRGQEEVRDTPTGRSELLPDIEEINSSLRSSADRDADEDLNPDALVAEQQKGGRLGFSVVLLMVALLVILYVFAPQISQRVPALAPTLTSYKESVDQGRIWLDDRIASLAQSADGAADTE